MDRTDSFGWRLCLPPSASLCRHSPPAGRALSLFLLSLQGHLIKACHLPLISTTTLFAFFLGNGAFGFDPPASLLFCGGRERRGGEGDRPP